MLIVNPYQHGYHLHLTHQNQFPGPRLDISEMHGSRVLQFGLTKDWSFMGNIRQRGSCADDLTVTYQPCSTLTVIV